MRQRLSAQCDRFRNLKATAIEDEETAYVFAFAPVKPFEPANGDALLAEFKSGLPKDVNFHDFEWGNGGARVIVDGRRSADAVRDMFNKNPRLKRLDVAIFPGGLLD